MELQFSRTYFVCENADCLVILEAAFSPTYWQINDVICGSSYVGITQFLWGVNHHSVVSNGSIKGLKFFHSGNIAFTQNYNCTT